MSVLTRRWLLPTKDAEVEELRQTVRDLALRVSTLEKQLNQQQTAVSAPAADGAVESAASSSLSNAVVAEVDVAPAMVTKSCCDCAGGCGDYAESDGCCELRLGAESSFAGAVAGGSYAELLLRWLLWV